MKYWVVLFIASTIVADVAAQSAPATNCAAIENARERLACFDSQFPRGEGAAPLPRIKSEPVRAPSTLGQEGAAPTSEVGSVASTSPLPTPAPQPREQGGLFSWTEELDLDSEITALRRGDQQRMVFRLANGQIWMQNAPRDLPFRQGDKVNIKNGRIGGYIMRSESGTSTRVRRIE